MNHGGGWLGFFFFLCVKRSSRSSWSYKGWLWGMTMVMNGGWKLRTRVIDILTLVIFLVKLRFDILTLVIFLAKLRARAIDILTLVIFLVKLRMSFFLMFVWGEMIFYFFSLDSPRVSCTPIQVNLITCFLPLFYFYDFFVCF